MRVFFGTRARLIKWVISSQFFFSQGIQRKLNVQSYSKVLSPKQVLNFFYLTYTTIITYTTTSEASRLIGRLTPAFVTAVTREDSIDPSFIIRMMRGRPSNSIKWIFISEVYEWPVRTKDLIVKEGWWLSRSCNSSQIRLWLGQMRPNPLHYTERNFRDKAEIMHSMKADSA